MTDPDFPMETARAGIKQEKTKLARIEAELGATQIITGPAWSVQDYRNALHDGLGDIAGLLGLATTEEKSMLHQLLGLELTYTRTGPGTGRLAATLRPHLDSRGAVLRVEGGTRYKSPR